MGAFIDLTGQKFGLWTVLRRAGKTKNGGSILWECRCRCGKVAKHASGGLRFGSTGGCYACMYPNRTHGMTKSRLYSIWGSMSDRCDRPKHMAYHNYGGRGIRVIWESFEEFQKDMGPSYLLHVEQFGEKQTTIDRIDNDGNYCKENCRWATYKEQHANKRKKLT